MEIKNKIAIVTGSSQGIGLATAKLLSEKGAKVVLAARSEEILKKLEKEIPNSFSVVTDMRKSEDIKKLAEKTISKYGRIDILINNAGQGMHGFSVENMDIENYKQIMELNLYSVIRLMQAVIPKMRKQGGGMIVNVSSGLTKIYVPYLAPYSSTKYALNAISLIARQELEKDKIIVSIVVPGMTATNFMKNAIKSGTVWNPNRPMPKIDSAEKVAEKIAELINTEQAEMIV